MTSRRMQFTPAFGCRYDRAVNTYCLALWVVVALLAGCRREVAELPSKATTVVAPAVPTPPQKPEEPLGLTWDRLTLPIPPDANYEPWMMTTRVQALDGRQVRIEGYMFGGLFQTKGIHSFPLVKDKECAFGEGCQPYHAIQVELAGDLTANYTASPVTIEGQLKIRPWNGPNGKTWSLYHLEATKME
jgi:hypothetical protein